MYHSLYASTDTVFTASDRIGGLREDAKRIYFYNNITASETLLFDFNLQPGDTVHQGTFNFIVRNIDSVNISGTYHKRFHFRTYEGAAWAFGSWIEGIGNSDVGGLLESVLSQPTCDCGSNIICFKQEGTWLYHNSNYASLDCVPDALSIGDMEMRGITVTLSPNPVTGASILKITTDHMLTRFSIYNMTGALVYTQKISNGNTVSIHKENYANGIYWYRVQDNKGHTTVGKFVVQ